MLRLTEVVRDGKSVTVKVEGEIVSEWSAVLEDECVRRAADRQVILDFSDVTLIDGRAIDVLRRLRGLNITLNNCSHVIEELLGEP